MDLCFYYSLAPRLHSQPSKWTKSNRSESQFLVDLGEGHSSSVHIHWAHPPLPPALLHHTCPHPTTARLRSPVAWSSPRAARCPCPCLVPAACCSSPWRGWSEVEAGSRGPSSPRQGLELGPRLEAGGWRLENGRLLPLSRVGREDRVEIQSPSAEEGLLCQPSQIITQGYK